MVYRSDPWFGGLSYATREEPIEAMIERIEAEGWRFVAVIPGDESAVACEHHRPPRLLFRRVMAEAP